MFGSMLSVDAADWTTKPLLNSSIDFLIDIPVGVFSNGSLSDEDTKKTAPETPRLDFAGGHYVLKGGVYGPPQSIIRWLYP